MSNIPNWYAGSMLLMTSVNSRLLYGPGGVSSPFHDKRCLPRKVLKAATYMSLSPLCKVSAKNVLPHPGPAQIRGRPSDVERLLDEAGQRAQEVERGAEATEEGEVAVAAEGVGGAFGYLGGLAEGAAALAPTAGEVAGTLAGAAGVGAAGTAGLAVGVAGGAAYGLARGTGWVLENTLFRPQQGSEDVAVQDVRSANNMNDATQPQHFTLRTGSSSAEAFLGMQTRVLQGPRVGVLAGLYKIVQVEVACDERGGLAVRLVQGQRLVPL